MKSVQVPASVARQQLASPDAWQEQAHLSLRCKGDGLPAGLQLWCTEAAEAREKL